MNKEQVRSKNLHLLKWDRTKEIEATLQADQALKHISESLLTKKKKREKNQHSDGGEWGQIEWSGVIKSSGGREGKTEKRKEDAILTLLSPLPWSVFSQEDRPVRARVWNWAVTLSVCWSESESLSHLSPGNHSSLHALSGHHTNHSQASWD